MLRVYSAGAFQENEEALRAFAGGWESKYNLRVERGRGKRCSRNWKRLRSAT
jgi:hypothetical protein